MERCQAITAPGPLANVVGVGKQLDECILGSLFVCPQLRSMGSDVDGDNVVRADEDSIVPGKNAIVAAVFAAIETLGTH